MYRPVMLIAGVMLGFIAVLLLVTAAGGDFLRTIGSDLGWAEPYMRIGAIVVGGLSLAASMVLIGLSMGRWTRPVGVHDAKERHHHGLRE